MWECPKCKARQTDPEKHWKHLLGSPGCMALTMSGEAQKAFTKLPDAPSPADPLLSLPETFKAELSKD